MNDIEVSSIDLVEGGNVFKQGHYLTLGYTPRDEKGETVDLSGKTLNVSLWGRKGVVFEAAATYSGGVIRFTFDKLVAAGDYTVEFTATSSTDAKYRKKFPTNQHSGRIAIKQSADDLGVVGIQVYTVAQLKAEQKALLDAAVSNFTVDSETQMARVSDDKTYTSLRARLEGDKQETAQQLAEMLVKGQVSVSDIDKNKGKLDQTYLSDGLLQQIAGTAPVNATPADGSVTIEKIGFTKVISRNLFNRNDAFNGYVNTADGSYVASGDVYSSSFIAVNPGDTLNFSHNVSRYALFNTSKAFIRGETLSVAITSLTIPEGVYNVKVTFYHTNLSTFMASVGSLPLTYEPFVIGIDDKYVPKQDVGKTVGEMLLETSNKNLFNKAKATTGRYLEAGGVLTANANLSTSDYIPVVEGAKITVTQMRTLGFFPEIKADTMFAYVTDGQYPSPYTTTVPVGAKYMRVSYKTEIVDTFQVEVGDKQTSYEVYNKPIIKKSLLPQVAATDLPKKEVIINLPKKVYSVQGTEMNIYFDNIIEGNYKDYQIDVSCDKGSQESRRWNSKSISSGESPLSITLYKNYTEVVATANTTSVVKPVGVGAGVNKKMLLIGDSTVRTDGTGAVTQRLLEKFNADVMDITLLGSMGTAPNLWEGRGGWSAATYRSNATYANDGNKVNPFYNPAKSDFDFAYYMAQKGYSSVDYVVLNLGINDTFGMTNDNALLSTASAILQHYDFLINNIKAFNPNVKIGINMTIPPNDSQDAFGLAYGNAQTQWRYKRNNILWVNKLMTHFENVPNVHLVPIHVNIDTLNYIGDGVHPKLEGYNQIGDTMFAWLKSFEV